MLAIRNLFQLSDLTDAQNQFISILVSVFQHDNITKKLRTLQEILDPFGTRETEAAFQKEMENPSQSDKKWAEKSIWQEVGTLVQSNATHIIKERSDYILTSFALAMTLRDCSFMITIVRNESMNTDNRQRR